MPTGIVEEAPGVRRWIALLSGLIFVVVAGVLFGTPPPHAAEVGMLPTLNALLNTGSACCLVVGYAAIRGGHRGWHERAMLAACGFSGAFLVTYLMHHARVGSVPFQGRGWLRSLYFVLLVPHIVLAAAIVPLALLTIFRGLTGRFEAHRRIARITLPLWLFVSVSGVAVYWMLYRI